MRSFVCLLLIFSVTAQLDFSAKLVSSKPGGNVQRYGLIRESHNREWTNLGSIFSVEFWFKAEGPKESPYTGSWKSSHLGKSHQYIPLVVRHPQHGAENEKSHFIIQLVRNSSGMAVQALAGCGCEDSSDPSTCGFGYVLSSDSHHIPEKKRVHIVPGTWNHIAVTFDGDDLMEGDITKKAALYINGEFVTSSKWAADHRICSGKGMINQFVEGAANDIRLGYLKNKDSRTRPEASSEYGFNGLIDELRIWKESLKAETVNKFYDIALLDASITSTYPGLVAYYRFNNPEAHPTFSNYRTSGVPIGSIVGEDASDDKFYTPENPPSAKLVYVVGDQSIDESGDPGATFNFQIDREAKVRITGFSRDLEESIASGKVSFAFANKRRLSTRDLGMVVDSDSNVQVFAECASNCEELRGYTKRFYIEYEAIVVNVTTITGRIYFQFDPACPAGFDSCGVCGGDGSTCSCVYYRNWRSSRLTYILVQYELNEIISYLNCSIEALAATLDLATSPSWEFDYVSPSVLSRVNFLMNFYNSCLTPYCGYVSQFMNSLTDYLQQLSTVTPPM